MAEPLQRQARCAARPSSPSPVAADSPPSRPTAARPAPGGRRSAPDGGSMFSEPKRSSTATRPPAAARSTTAWAVSWPPSSNTSHSTPAAYSDHRLVGAEHEQPVAERLQPDRHLAELGPWRELQACDARARQDPDEGRAAAARPRLLLGAVVGRRHLALEPVGDGDARPAGLHRHRSRPVPLAERNAVAGRGDGEVPGPSAAEDVGEDRRRIRARVAQPRHPRVGRQQRHGRAVGEHRVPFDRHRVLAVEPAPAGLEQKPENADRIDRMVDPVRRQRCRRRRS